MLKILTAGLLALILSATSLAPTAARAELSDDDVALGLLTLLLLGVAIHESRDDDRRAPASQVHVPRVDPQPQRPRPEQGHPRRNADWNVLPAECRRTLDTRQGEVRLFTRACLSREWGRIHLLPDHCYREVRTLNGHTRRGWVPRCLGRAGFVASDRR